MILADKIIEERKRLGLSQEELAEKLSVSRQAVSKWEGAQSVPDLQKIIAMSELFSVTTDYLLKDNMEPERKVAEVDEYDAPLRRVSMEEANEFMALKKENGKKVALGVLMCILSTAPLIFLAGLSVAGLYGITETIATAAGTAVMFILIAAAVFLFIQCGARSDRFEYLEKKPFETVYGVSGLVKEKQSEFEPTYARFLALGIILCVLSPVPLIVGVLFNDGEAIATALTAVMFLIVAVGVYMIIRVSAVRSGYNILLQEREYAKTEKKKNSAIGAVSAVYWCLIPAIYLTWSFISEDWSRTWIVWPIAALLNAPIAIIVSCLGRKRDNK